MDPEYTESGGPDENRSLSSLSAQSFVLPDRSYKTQLLSTNIQRRLSLPTSDLGNHVDIPGTYASLFRQPYVSPDASSLPTLGLSYMEACVLGANR